MEFDDYKNDFFREIAKTNNEIEIEKFLSDILTESELHDIIVRWSILNDIMQNIPQRTIAKKYGTSVSKTNKCSTLLKNKNSYITKKLKYKYDETFLKTSL